MLAFLGTVAAGAFGATIGYGLVDIGCEGDCDVAKIVGMVVGAVVATVGVGVVAVLVLRAMSEWRRPRAEASGPLPDEPR
ncbi:MAG: hypothetical protein M5U14_07445 [Acidimicrobiia bacterium]|nr:hypothetical protein [Acidimicrobiia bacterium]